MHDFIARYLDQGIKAGLNTKKICTFMATQLPIEVRQAAKEWILARGEELGEEFGEAEGISFAVKARELLLGKGLTLTQGCRDGGPERVSQIRPADDGSGTENEGPGWSDTESPPKSDKVKVVERKSKYKATNYSQSTRGSDCYICHKPGHGYKKCPDRPCGICGRLGHKPFRCPREYSSRTPNRRGMKGKAIATRCS